MLRVMATLTAFVALTAVGGAAATTLPGAVQSIQIDSTWAGLGRPRVYHGTILRKGNGFVRDDGLPVNAKLVDALLASLKAPHRSIALSDIGLTSDLLRSHLAEEERWCLGATRSDPAVLRAFDGEYLDQSRILPLFGPSRYASPSKDDYPHFTMRIFTTTGEATISSRAAEIYMLPFTVKWNGKKERIYDPLVAFAIATLLPDGAANKRRMEPRSLLSNWADVICNSEAVRDAQNAIGRATVTRLAARYSLRVTSYDHTSTAKTYSWDAWVEDANDPRITAEVNSSTTRGDADLALTQRRMALIRRIPWLNRALDATKDAWIHIDPGAGIFSFDPPRFREKGHTHAAALLEAHAKDATILWMGESSLIREDSQWYLFPDGTMILEEFIPSMQSFPFGPGGYSKLPLIGPLPTPDLNDPSDQEDAVVAGLIVHPDGTIETANP